MEGMIERIEHTEKGGIGAFFYSAIPAVLGCAALAWLAFATGTVEFRHDAEAYSKKQTYEGRREARVGVNGEILQPVDLIYKSGGCVRVDRAFLDTQTLTIYVSNQCPTDRRFAKYTVREVSPDGTTIHSDYAYLPNDGTISVGEKQELTATTSSDARVVKIIVSVDGGREP